MTAEVRAAQMRENYLTKLDVAMREIPHGIANEIRAGIIEELEGTDSDTIADRIAQLGDPEAIAREAQAAVAPIPTPSSWPQQATATSAIPTFSKRSFAVVAALTLGFGGIVLPAVGWIIGAVLVCFSGFWRTREKVVAIVLPFAGAALSVAVSTVMWAIIDPGNGISGETINPLVPATYDVLWSTMLASLILVPVSGLWLLWKIRDRYVACGERQG